MRESAFETIEKSEKQRKQNNAISMFRERSQWQQVVLLALSAFLFIEFWGWIGTRFIPAWIGWGEGIRAVQSLVDIASSLPGWFARWDSGYYLYIVEHGYATSTALTFFPLYPLLVSGISHLSSLPELRSGLLLSTLCFLGSSVLLYRWTLIDHEVETARLAVIWYCVFPMAFFLVAIYAESLFLLLGIASFYFARKGNFIASGIAIAFAGATRQYGFLLAVPFIGEFILQQNFKRNDWLKFITGALIAPLGTLGYLGFLAWQTGEHNLLAAYMSTTKNWEAFSFTWPWNTWLDGLRAAFFGTGVNPDWFSRALAWQDLAYAVFGLVISIYAWKHLRPSLSAFLSVSMLFFYMNHGPAGYAFWSISRHVLILFPIYLALALLTGKLPVRYRWVILTVSILLLGLYSAWFASGRWVA